MMGHARAKVNGATRSACAVASGPITLLIIERDDYIYFLSGGSRDLIRQNLIDPRSFILEKQAALFVENPEFFKKISIFFEFNVWSKDEIIVDQGSTINDFFWIVQGSCSTSKNMSFLSQTNQASKTMMKIFEADDVIGPDRCVVDVQVSTQDQLQVGDWFPYVPFNKEEREIFTDQKDLIYRDRVVNGCEYQIKADSKCITASVNFADFLFLASPTILQHMIQNSSVTKYDSRQLQDEYLKQRAWGEHKKDTIEKLVSSKKKR